MNKRVVILQVDDWEALYIDGKSVQQGHELEEGDKLFILKMAEEYNFKSEDVHIEWVTETVEQAEYLMSHGHFPKTLEEWEKI